MLNKLFFSAAVFCSIVFSIGCEGPNRAKEITRSFNKTNIQKVANSFVLYASMNQNRSPKNKEELVDYITTSKHIDYNLDMMDIDPAGFPDLFVSSVDGEEFVIRYRARVSAMGSNAPLVFEKTGVDGIRRVALANGRIIEADDKAYERLMKGKLIDSEKAKSARAMMEEGSK
jgi:hypothetical protein